METARLTSGLSRCGGKSYADNLPSASVGAPFPRTPGTMLSLAKINSNEMQRVVKDHSDKLISIHEYYTAIVLWPDVIFRKSQGIQ